MNRIVQGDNLKVLQHMKTGSVELIYVDPPFNTGKRQSRTQMKTVRDEAGDRVGFGGRRYRTEVSRRNRQAAPAMATDSTTSSGFCGPAWWRRTACCRRPARCFSTSTTARCTTAR